MEMEMLLVNLDISQKFSFFHYKIQLKYKKICVITGSRADYGILKGLIKKIKFHQKFKLQLIVTGSHLSDKYGSTISEIYNDGLKANIKLKI